MTTVIVPGHIDVEGHINSHGVGIRNSFETTTDPTAACDRGRAWPSRSRTQGAALGGAKRKPEDAEMRSRHARHPGARGRGVGGLVPDAPVTKFTLSMNGGKKGLLVNSENICSPNAKTHAVVNFTGQNGKTYNTTPAVANSCKGKKKHKGVRHEGNKGKKHHHRGKK